MPYAIKKSGKGYVVETIAGKNKGHKHSKHPLSHIMAEKQIRAMIIHGADKK